ncbi:MAG: PQQ-binding-like beta-propeller repeat protein, partial [Planctomycetota bacterium]
VFDNTSREALATVVSDDGFLYGVDAANGSLIWKVLGGPSTEHVIGNERVVSRWPARGAPVFEAGVVYFAAGLVPSGGAFVHAVDAKSGKKLWTNDGTGSLYVRQDHSSKSFAGVSPQGYLVIRDNTLIVPGGRTTPAYFDKTNGRLISYRGFDPPDAKIPIRKAKHGWAGSWFITAKGLRGDPRTGPFVDGKAFDAKSLPIPDGKVLRTILADDKIFCTTDEGRLFAFGKRTDAPKEHAAPAGELRTTPDAAKLAKTLLDGIDASGGFGLVDGIGNRDLLHALATQFEGFTIALDDDRATVDTSRRELHAAGVYGSRVSVHNATISDPYEPPRYSLSLLVSQKPKAAPRELRRLLDSLRPYGGRAVYPASTNSRATLAKVVELSRGELGLSEKSDWVVIDRGPPKGASDWTHEYGDSANTLNSRDALVRAPLGLLWFGGESARLKYFNRASSAPSPLVAKGRMFLQGPGHLYALDIYTGRVLWKTALPSGQTPYKDAATVDAWRKRLGYSAVTDGKSVFLATGLRLLKIHAANGKLVSHWDLPASDLYVKEIRVSGETLVATTPRSVHALSTRDGKTIWRREISKDVVLGKFVWNGLEHGNLGTAVSRNHVFGIYGMTDEEIQRQKRRGKSSVAKRILLALDLATGDTVWHLQLPKETHTCLLYSSELDVLIQGPGYRPWGSGPKVPVVAYRGRTGEPLWKKVIPDSGPFIVHGRRLVTQGHRALEIETGKPALRRDPVTNSEVAWSFHKDYGCNYAIASESLLTFRSGAAGFCDIASTGTGNFGGFRSGCRNSLIPAGGVVASAKFANGCICSYPMLTSMAFVPAKTAESWSVLDSVPAERPIRRVGLNLGAPGDAVSPSGTAWFEFPEVGGPASKLEVQLAPSVVEPFRYHASRVRQLAGGRGDAARPWVGASGVYGLTSISIGLRNSGAQTYTVRLFFTEWEHAAAGQRTMNVKINGNTVLSNFDVVTEVGRSVVIVKKFSGISARDRLLVELEATKGRTCLSGIELIAE